jgi:hypothetical protein
MRLPAICNIAKKMYRYVESIDGAWEMKFYWMIESFITLRYGVSSQFCAKKSYFVFPLYLSLRSSHSVLENVAYRVALCVWKHFATIDQLDTFLWNSVWPIYHWMSHQDLLCKFLGADSRNMQISELGMALAQLPKDSLVMNGDYSEHTRMSPL